jgi:hypothetical protein
MLSHYACLYVEIARNNSGGAAMASVTGRPLPGRRQLAHGRDGKGSARVGRLPLNRIEPLVDAIEPPQNV